MSSRGIILGIGLGVVLLPSLATAQEWQTLTSRRQYAVEKELRVDVEFGAGQIQLEPGAAGALYEAQIRYDAEVFEPYADYNAESLRVGLKSDGKTKKKLKEGGRLTLKLGPEVPVDLNLTFGAAEAEIELGGVRIRNTAIKTGASDTKLRFSKPNTERMEALVLHAGAAAIHATGLANANAKRVDVKGGVGDVLLDFTGEWRGDTEVHVEMGLGSLKLRIPRGVGVRVGKDTFLMSFDSQELVKRGNTYYSTDWDKANHRLTIDIGGALGSIEVQWVDGGARTQD